MNTIDTVILAFFVQPGPQELMLVGMIALLLFGKRLPEVARNLGKGFSEFKKGMNSFQDEVRKADNDVHRNIDYSGSNTSSNADRPESDLDETEDDFAAPKMELDD